jgi:hypothetical protein
MVNAIKKKWRAISWYLEVKEYLMARNIEYSYFSLFLFDCGSLKVGLV